MTDTETTETVDPGRWPVPNGTLLSSEGHGFLDLLTEYADALQGEVLDLMKNAPVKAREDEYAKYLHDLGTIVDKLETALDSIKETQQEAAAKLAQGLPFGTAFVAWPDLRPMKPRFPKDRTKWDNELLQAAVLRRILEKTPRLGNMDTGEAYDPREVVDAVLDVVSLNGSNAKAGGIKRLDLDPDDYCHAEKAQPSVQIQK